MAIKIEDIERLDFHDIADIPIKKLPATHPGEYLAEILNELGISQAELARAIGVSSMRVSHVVRCARPVTAELALLFGRAFGQSPSYWMNLQAIFDLKTAESNIGKRLPDVHEFAHE
ncbi:antitoxin HigA-1 [Gammaproteobacteria bacterium]